MPASNTDDVQYRRLVQGVTDYAIYMLDPLGHVTNWNAGAERAKGYPSEEIIGRHVSCFYGRREQAAGIPNANLDIARQTGRFETEGWRYRRDGSRFWANVVIEAIHVDGLLVGFAKITRDCTEKRRQSIALEAASANLRLVLSVLPYGACLLDYEMRITLCNPAFGDLFGVACDAIDTGTNLFDFIRRRTASTADPAILDLALFFRQKEQWGAPYELSLGDRHLSVMLRPTDDQGLVVTLQDITERILHEKAVLYKARHDALTGFANREALGDHLREVLSRPEPRCTVICFDLDTFKMVNDTFGHLAGDVLLSETAQRISKAVKPDDFVCRLGGSEFVVVSHAPLTGRQVRKLGERLFRQINKPFLLDGTKVNVGVSIGMATCPDAGTTSADLIANADIALFKARRGGGGCCVYDAETGLSALKRRATELRLRGALAGHEFKLNYQPICASDGNDIKGFEALLRWTQSNGVMVPPVEFIPACRRTRAHGRNRWLGTRNRLSGSCVLARSYDCCRQCFGNADARRQVHRSCHRRAHAKRARVRPPRGRDYGDGDDH